MIIIPASAGLILAIILVVVFRRYIAFLFGLVMFVGVLVTGPFFGVVLGALSPAVCGFVTLIVLVASVGGFFRRELQGSQGIVIGIFFLLLVLPFIGGMIYGAYNSFQQGCSIWCPSQYSLFAQILNDRGAALPLFHIDDRMF